VADQGPSGAVAPQRRRGGFVPRVVAILAVAAAVGAPPAAAENLNLDAGQSARLQGVVRYDVVYVDNGARLEFSGDTHLIAQQVYIGSTANVLPCWTAGGDNTCTAGRNIIIAASGPVVIERNIDLRAAGAAPERPGGSLLLAGSSVSVGGTITTTGVGALSGNVTLTASLGGVSSEAITAPGAAVNATGPAGVTIAGDVQVDSTGFTLPSPGSGAMPAAGTVTLGAPGGDVAVLGAIRGTGINGSPTVPIGGSAGALTASGRSVTLGAVTLRPGTSSAATAGARGSLAVIAAESASIGAIDLTGANGVPSAPGGTVAITAGTTAVTGTVNVNGAVAAATGAGSPAGTIAIATVGGAFGNMQASGANSSGVGNRGADAGSIRIAGTGAITTGSLTANGGNAGASSTADGAPGGVIDVKGANVTTGTVSANAGTTNLSGVAGGSVRLSAEGSLSVGSGAAISVSTMASANAALPTLPGAPGGPVLLRAATGVLRTGGLVRTTGSAGGPANGAARAGAGGAGGAVDLVAARLGALGGIVTLGGNAGSGTTMGPTANQGGAGGAIRIWSDESILGAETRVDTTGGTGSPNGPDGEKTQETSPTGLAVDPLSGALSFRTDSPHAQGYRVFRSLAGAAQEPVLDTTSTSGVAPPELPVCSPVTYTVQAYHAGVGWLSGAIGPVGWQRPPSAAQGCADPPPMRLGKKLRVKAKALRRAKWKLSVALNVDGVGSLSALLMPAKPKRSTKPFATLSRDVAAAGKIKLVVVLPKAARKAGKLVLHFETHALQGTVTKRGAVTVEVLK
jgi:hypothetical protein